MRYVLSSAIIIALLMALAPTAALAQQECVLFDQSTEEVLPGVTLTWDSSFLCENAEPEGDYTFTVNVSNDAGSTEAVTIDSLALSHTTPRPGGTGPEASVTGVAGLPLILAPGDSGQFTVTGTYELVTTDEGDKANLHFIASGHGNTSGEWFGLGINAHFRAEGAVENGDGNGGAAGGPPAWVTAGPPQ